MSVRHTEGFDVYVKGKKIAEGKSQITLDPAKGKDMTVYLGHGQDPLKALDDFPVVESRSKGTFDAKRIDALFGLVGRGVTELAVADAQRKMHDKQPRVYVDGKKVTAHFHGTLIRSNGKVSARFKLDEIETEMNIRALIPSSVITEDCELVSVAYRDKAGQIHVVPINEERE